MNIKDYLHLYLGCEAIDTISNGKVFLQGVSLSENMCQFESEYDENCEDWGNIEFFKPILRPLSDMTEEERIEAKEYVPLNKKSFDLHLFSDVIEAARDFHWLLSKHFDLFGLIDAGLAIDKTTLK